PDDPSTRRLPNYEDLSQAPAVTQIDDDIQSRLQQMQRASLADSHRPALPNLPPPPPSRAPPSLPPPPPLSAPPGRTSDAPLPSFRTPSGPDTETAPETAATVHQLTRLRNSDSEPAEPTEVMDGLPPSDPPELRAPPPPMPMLSLPAAPSLLSALRQRVRFAGGELPLWSLLTPMVLLLAL